MLRFGITIPLALAIATSSCGSASMDAFADDSGSTDVPAVDGAAPDVAQGDGAAPNIVCTGAAPTFSADVVPILSGCSGENCHGWGYTGAYSALVNAPPLRDSCGNTGSLIVPGKPSDSYLIHKLTGTGICPGTLRMPPWGTLGAPQIQTIVDWVCRGAKDD